MAVADRSSGRMCVETSSALFLLNLLSLSLSLALALALSPFTGQVLVSRRVETRRYLRHALVRPVLPRQGPAELGGGSWAVWNPVVSVVAGRVQTRASRWRASACRWRIWGRTQLFGSLRAS